MTRPSAPPVLTDPEIEALIAVPKVLRGRLADLMPGSSAARASGGRVTLEGTDGTRFTVIARQGPADPTNFSVILRYDATQGPYRLMRCNGPHPSIHRNAIERISFRPAPHVHYATERYQRAGYKEDTFAEVTDAYTDLQGAIMHMLRTVNVVTDDGQRPMI